MNKTANRLFTTRLLLIAVDLLTIAGTFCALTFLRKALGGELRLEFYYKLWPFLIIFWGVFEKMKLYGGTTIYSGSSTGPVEEIRRIFYSLSFVFIVLGFSNYCYRPNDYLYSRAILLGTFLLCLIFIPANRIILRKICTRSGYWGVPAIIIGSGQIACKIFHDLNHHPEYGLKPIGYFTDQLPHAMPPDAQYLGELRDIPEKTKSLKVKYAIVAKDMPPEAAKLQQIIKQYGADFPHLLFIPQSLLNTSSGVIPKNIAGTLGLEIRHNLQVPSIYLIKRTVDYALTIPLLIATLPVMAIIGLRIKLDSPGPVFFKHRRVTKNGRQINIYKFRTMVDDATEQLTQLFINNPATKEEWEQYGKLENDPRITRVGRWLRKTSLDELPQLFNVLQGKLTLAGPRPLIRSELKIYGEAATLFDQVLPGVTGLWQVSGRNHLSYAERAKLDLYYVNNWSPWLDLYILAKTVSTVLFRHGAM